ncbi:hypothetical protein Tco_0033067, partial [Tanacetum coccineum]
MKNLKAEGVLITEIMHTLVSNDLALNDLGVRHGNIENLLLRLEVLISSDSLFTSHTPSNHSPTCIPTATTTLKPFTHVRPPPSPSPPPTISR